MPLLGPTSKLKREKEVSGACFKVMVTHTHILLTYKHNHTHPHLHTHYTHFHIYTHTFSVLQRNKTSLYVKAYGLQELQVSSKTGSFAAQQSNKVW